MTEFEHLLGLLEPWIREYGVAAVFLILMLESFGMPLPGESLLIVASILSGRGELSFVALFFAAWAGAVVGDSIGYLIGRKLGGVLLRRYGSKVGLTAERLSKVEAAFARWGPLAVAFARFFNVLRQLNGVVAGSLKMPWPKFLFFNALGGAAWVLTWTIVGYYIGLHGAGIATLMHKVGYAGAIVVLVAVLSILMFMHWRRARSEP